MKAFTRLECLENILPSRFMMGQKPPVEACTVNVPRYFPRYLFPRVKKIILCSSGLYYYQYPEMTDSPPIINTSEHLVKGR